MGQIGGGGFAGTQKTCVAPGACCAWRCWCQQPCLAASQQIQPRDALSSRLSLQVAMDAHGLMKVTHLLPLGEGRVPQVTHPLHALQSQAGGVMCFLILRQGSVRRPREGRGTVERRMPCALPI